MKTLTTYLCKKAEKQKLFVPYIMAGAQGLGALTEEITMLAKNGAAAIELGVPFSDPVADGPIIQEAGLRALERKVTLKKIIERLQNFDSPVPLILMGYTNSFFHYGLEKLAEDLANTDVKGFIIPDLPYEHRDLVLPVFDQADLALLQLISLTSPKERIKTLLQAAEGFVYAVTINGTTGTGKNYRDNLDEHLAAITAESKIPVLAGFGVSERSHVERFNACCDGVVVGSKIVQSLYEEGIKETGKFVASLTTPMKQADAV
ncbi:tryptophan synthase alpha chain [Enterococcus florum]|uniref:Tryptophan synthase alpha chain n=1 Tax=Enterococcus florum TaxID=2480627 RepID=A0A4P5PGB3_9ENTE|nr:tryptophan synthase subunit alpha [Enterococcus florum]GCF92533.1 tryptophan synthase alpha chain [Enterococcus florum]